MTRIRRIPPHGTDIDLLERCNDLCRRLCRETPELSVVREELQTLRSVRRCYRPAVELVGYFLGASAFSLFFQGSGWDALFSGFCGITICLCLWIMNRFGSNAFFKSIAASAVSAFLAVSAAAVSGHLDADKIIIGALMALVPGVCFTSALRDIMAGDMVTGLSKIAEGVLIGVAVALGTGAGMIFAHGLWGG